MYTPFVITGSWNDFDDASLKLLGESDRCDRRVSFHTPKGLRFSPSAASPSPSVTSSTQSVTCLQPGPVDVDATTTSFNPKLQSLLQLHRVDFSEFELDAPIGEGHFGQVFLATFRGRTSVALKRIVRERFRNSDTAELFLKEISMTASIPAHPNIVRFVAIAQSAASNWIATEYCEAGSLRGFLDEGVPLAVLVDARLGLATDIATGMAFLHAQSPPILHRDLSSNNVLLNPDSSKLGGLRALIGDFGLSRVKSMGTMTSQLGALAWMSPEVFLGDRYYESADLYSFAVICWELLTQRDPAKECQHPHLLAEKVSRGFRLPLETSPDAWKVLVNRCWHEDAVLRPSFAQVVTHLRDPGARSSLLEQPSRAAMIDFMALSNKMPVPSRSRESSAATTAPLYVEYADTGDMEDALHCSTGADGDRDEPSSTCAGRKPSTPPLLQVVTGHKDWVVGLGVVPLADRRRQALCSSSTDGQIKLFTSAGNDGGTSFVESGSVVAHQGYAFCVQPLGDRAPRLLVSGGRDAFVCVWDAAQLAPVKQLAGHGGGVRAVHGSPISPIRLCSCSEAGEIISWDVERGLMENVWKPRAHSSGGGATGRVAYCCKFLTPAEGGSGDFVVASGSDDGFVRLWDRRMSGLGSAVELHGHRAGVLCLDQGPVAGTLISGGKDCQAIGWDFRIQSPLRFYEFDSAVRDVSLINSSTFTVCLDNGMVALRRFDGQGPGVDLFPHGGNVQVFQVKPVPQQSNDVVVLASSASDGTIRLFSVDKGLNP